MNFIVLIFNHINRPLVFVRRSLETEIFHIIKSLNHWYIIYTYIYKHLYTVWTHSVCAAARRSHYLAPVYALAGTLLRLL